jgi:hypothetical protein
LTEIKLLTSTEPYQRRPMSKKNPKKARVASPHQQEYTEDTDVRLSKGLQDLLGGQQYVKMRELAKEVILAHLLANGDVVAVNLLHVEVVHNGNSFKVTMDDTENDVARLKRLVQDQHGTSFHSQQLFALAANGQAEDASGVPLANNASIAQSCSVALCIQEPTPHFIPNALVELSGSGNSCAQFGSWNNENEENTTVVEPPLGDSGVHTISFLIVSGNATCGVVKCDTFQHNEVPISNIVDSARHRAHWMMCSGGALYGNGNAAHNHHEAGIVDTGQMLTLQVDRTAGSLRFWRDGIPHGPGWESGVHGRLQWAVNFFMGGDAARIVATPELQPWPIEQQAEYTYPDA